MKRIMPLFKFFDLPGSIDRWLFMNLTRKMMKDQAYKAGLGHHTRSEVEGMCIKDLEAISLQLGSKPLLMGDQPSLVDWVLFGFVSMVLYCPVPESVYTPTIQTKFEPDGRRGRMREKFWPNFEQLLLEE